MNFITRWKTKRIMRKTAKLLRQLCENAPASFFNNFDFTVANPLTGQPAKDHIEARNYLLVWATRLEKA
jgi:hypothetical protein